MSCGDGVERGVATCICKGKTVFDGAVIGQLFTGDVQVQCPNASVPKKQISNDSGRPIASAMIAIAIWQSWITLSMSIAPGDVSLLQAVLFLVGAIAARYWKSEHGKVVVHRAREILSSPQITRVKQHDLYEMDSVQSRGKSDVKFE